MTIDIIHEDEDAFSPLELVAIAVHAHLPEEAWGFGQKYVSQHGPRRRYIWAPMDSGIVTPPQAGPRADQDGHLATASWAIELRARIRVYAETYGALDGMLRNLIAAATETLQADLRFPIPVRFVTQEDKKAGRTLRNELAILVLQVPTPVPETIAKLRQIGGYSDVCGTIQSDGSLKPQD